jgi:hypothetical protein
MYGPAPGIQRRLLHVERGEETFLVAELDAHPAGMRQWVSLPDEGAWSGTWTNLARARSSR